MKYSHVSLLVPLLILCACREPNQPTPPNVGPGAKAIGPVAATNTAMAVPAANAYPDGTAFATGTLCNIEFLGAQQFAGEPLQLQGTQTLRGWLAGDDGAAPQAVELRFSDSAGAVVARVPVTLGEQRDDVVGAFPGKVSSANTGFSLPLAAAGLPAGTWRIYLVYSGGGEAGKKPTACDNGRSLTIQVMK